MDRTPQNISFILKACCFALLVSSATGCSNDQKKQTDPAPQYTVQVKMISTDAAGLGAGAEIHIQKLQSSWISILSAILPDNGMKEKTITSLKTGELVNVGLVFDKARTGSGIVPRTTSKLRGEIWVNGQLKAFVELDRNTPSQNPDYPTDFAEYRMGE